MKALKNLAVAIGVVLGTSTMVQPAHAQFAVIDVANLQQNIGQYLQMIQQLKQLQAQLTQAVQQYKSITGSRGLGNILQENYTQIVPANWQETLNIMQGGGQVGQLATQIANEASQLKGSNFAGAAQQVIQGLQQNMNASASGQALNSEVYQEAGQRFTRIQDLTNQINSTQDLKGAQDLLNRLQAENLDLQNEALKLQAMNAMLTQQQAVKAQQMLQENMAARRGSKY
ncbi:MAG: hypothetical protein JSR64_09715 [Nitrospira sp.]|nr:hypothetical protein [Nitrospira sp.]MBS0194373.1 P-type DNA transfer protein VirB5 [Pseudomonadota bacterium]